MENMLVALATQLSHRGCRSVVGVFRNSRFQHTEIAEQAQQRGLPVEVIPCDGRWDWRAVAEIRRLLKMHNVDVLHPHGYKADLYALAAARAGNRVALLATSHNWPSKLLSMRAYAALDRLALRRFDKVVVVSDVVAGILRRSGVAADQIELIPNGVDLERFSNASPKLRSELGLGENPVVGFVGRLVPEKGGALLIRAARQVLAAYPKTLFVLVGEGPARQQWTELAAELGVDKHIILTGERGDMPEVYASFDLMVLPSQIEAMPMCLLEAMAAGKPVIATNVGAIPRLVVDGKTGLLVESNHDALAAAILRLLQKPDLACELANGGRAHVAQHFSAETMAKNYIAMYEQILIKRSRSPRREPALEVN